MCFYVSEKLTRLSLFWRIYQVLQSCSRSRQTFSMLADWNVSCPQSNPHSLGLNFEEHCVKTDHAMVSLANLVLSLVKHRYLEALKAFIGQ